MNKTPIKWVKNPDGTQGYTWNPITGCLNGCPYCYARKLANTRLRERYLANENICPRPHALEGHDPAALADPFYPRFWEDRLEEITAKQQPRGIFTCDMSDLFGIGIPEKWTWRTINLMTYCSQHRFYLLTKQPQNLVKFSPFPDNCWVGVTATDESMFHNACYYLEKVSARVKYLSLEPLLSFREDGFNTERLKIAGINQIIIGSQTKPYKPPKIEWVEEIVEACDKAGVAVFLKENLYDFFMDLPHDDLYWEDMSHLRQEMPK